MKKLTNKQIVKILKECYNKIKNDNIHYKSLFLCNRLSGLIQSKLDLVYDENLASENIPLFTHENAAKHANANPLDKDGNVPYVWFDVNNLTPGYPDSIYYNNQNRLIFLKWLIEQYSK